MADRLQIHVLKEGTFDEKSWSDRTLTIDAATESATISRHNHPNTLYHHSMHVLGIQKWPHVNKGQTGHGHDSAEAKRTLHLIGEKVPTVKFEGGEDAHSTNSAGTGSCTPGTGATTPSNHPDGADSEVDDSWMIRCHTDEDYAAAVALLEKIVHARHARLASAHPSGQQHAKDEERLRHFALPQNASAPATTAVAAHAPIL